MVNVRITWSRSERASEKKIRGEGEERGSKRHGSREEQEAEDYVEAKAKTLESLIQRIGVV